MAIAAVLLGLLMAWVMSRLLGRAYLTLILPIGNGWLIGTFIGLIGARYRPDARLPFIAAALLGAFVMMVGYHVWAYTSILDVIVGETQSRLDQATSNVNSTIMTQLEALTGEEGLLAYLAFTLEGEATIISPIGLAARLNPPLWLALTIVVVEFVVASAVAVISALRHAPHGPAAPPAVSEHRIGSVDGDRLVDVLGALREGDCVGAADLVNRSDGPIALSLAVEDATQSACVIARRADGSVATTRRLTWGEARLLQEGLAEGAAPGDIP